MKKTALLILCFSALTIFCNAASWLWTHPTEADQKQKMPNALFFRNAQILEGNKGEIWTRVSGPASKIVIYNFQKKKVRETPAVTGEVWSAFDSAGLPPGQYAICIEQSGKSMAEGVFWIEKPNWAERERIKLFIDEPIGADWKEFPVRIGIPLKPSAIDSTESMRITDKEGREIPSQIKVTAYCTPEKKDIRWVLTSFFASSAQSKGSEYYFEYGRKVKPGLSSGSAGPAIKVTEDSAAVTVDTGPLRFTVDKQSGQIIRDLYYNNALVLTNGGLFVQNQERTSFSSCFDKPEVVVEEAGPMFATIAIRGWYKNASGQTFCRYLVRAHAFAGKPYLKIYHTWIMTEDSRKVKIGDISIRLPLAGKVQRCAFGIDDRYANEPFEGKFGWLAGFDLFGKERMLNLVQEDSDRFKIYSWSGGNKEIVKEGKSAGGWLAAWSDKAGILLHVRDMWELYPAELEVKPGAIAMHFWPEHGFSFKHRQHSIERHRWPLSDGEFMDLQPREWVEGTIKLDKEFIHGYDKVNAKGLARTHELWLFAGPKDATPDQMQKQAAHFEKPLAGRADPEWISTTGVFRPFLPYNPVKFPEIEASIEARWKAVLYNQNLSHNYGWLFWGNQQTMNYIVSPKAQEFVNYATSTNVQPFYKRIHRYWKGLAYRSGMEPWLLWMRSGNREYFDFAEALTRQIEDVYIVNHDRPDVEPKAKKGYRYTCCFIPYNSNCDPDGTHMDAVGQSRMGYYLTGCQRSYEIVYDVGNAELDYDFKNSMPITRNLMGTSHNMLEAYYTTHNEKYWQAVWPGINRLLDCAVHHAFFDSTLMYYWELFYDWYNLHGDSRVRPGHAAVLDAYRTKPLGETREYPIIFHYAHLYELTGKREYLASGFGDLIMNLYNINLTSTNDWYFGQAGYGDPIGYTRTILQTPGIMDYLDQAGKRDKIYPHFRPIRFSGDPRLLTGEYATNIPNRGPVYFLDENDTNFNIKIYFMIPAAKTNFQVKAALYSPDGKPIMEKKADSRDFAGSATNLPYLEFGVPADSQKGQYKLKFDFDPVDIGYTPYGWGIECTGLNKIAYAMKKFESSGVTFFKMPEKNEKFKLLVYTGSGYKGNIVIIDAQGKVVKRLDGQHGTNEFPREDAAFKPGEMYGILGCALEVLEGQPAFFSNAEDYFLVELK